MATLEPESSGGGEARRPAAKRELRARMREALAAVEEGALAEASGRIRRRLLELPELREAPSVFTYVSAGAEVATLALIDALLERGVTVAVPSITGPGVMEACRIRSRSDLVEREFGILAPARPEPLEASPALCLCPGLAFTTGGDRLGRGKAYYDRWLARSPSTRAIGLALELQVLEEIPVESTDRRLDGVVTEARVIRT